MPKILSCLLLVLACLGAPSLVRAAECTEIDTTGGPITISAAGNYCLVNALFLPGMTIGNLVTIASPNVDLDCRGVMLHNANTDPSGNANAIYLQNRQHVTVRNCHITGGWAAGIYAYQNNGLANVNQDLTITGNTVSGAFWYGIFAYGTDIDIRDNRIYDIGGRGSFAMGIRVGGSIVAGQPRSFNVRDNLIRDVVSTVNYGYGIYANNSYGSSFVGNSISGTAGTEPQLGYGVFVASGNRDKITGNQITGPQSGQDVGISGPAGDACYDNFIRSGFVTMGCNDSLGNF